MEKFRVLNLSYSNCANFGDRLGSLMLNQMMPPWVEITQSFLPPFWENPQGTYDLIIIGNGHSIFFKTLSGDILTFIESNPNCIGIFGIQYKAMMPKEKTSRLFESLDYWFARNIDDLEYIGDVNTNCIHLGDWLINAFPMCKWSLNKELVIKPDFISKNADLLSIIRGIQKYKTVSSARLHPLLCSLTSAENVRFIEQKEMGNNIISGKFSSMLKDIFGKSFPENELFNVDRELVYKYKEYTYNSAENMKNIIRKICQQ